MLLLLEVKEKQWQRQSAKVRLTMLSFGRVRFLVGFGLVAPSPNDRLQSLLR